MLCTSDGTCTGVLIDFGKGCLLKSGRRYHLAPSVQKKYLIKHPQIPQKTPTESHSERRALLPRTGQTVTSSNGSITFENIGHLFWPSLSILCSSIHTTAVSILQTPQTAQIPRTQRQDGAATSITLAQAVTLYLSTPVAKRVGGNHVTQQIRLLQHVVLLHDP